MRPRAAVVGAWPPPARHLLWMDYSVYSVGQRIRLTCDQRVSGGDGKVTVPVDTLATVASSMGDHLRAWVDQPTYELPLTADEFVALDEIWSDEQRLALTLLQEGPQTTAEIDAALRAQGGVPAKRKPRYWDRYLMYVLTRMSLVDVDYDYPGYPQESRYLITAAGRQAIQAVPAPLPLGPRQRLSTLAS